MSPAEQAALTAEVLRVLDAEGADAAVETLRKGWDASE